MKKILVIDDDRAVLNYLNLLLMQAGEYEPTTLQESKKAYKVLQDSEYDLLILDMDMPEVSGLDILKYINKNSIDIETIILTGVEDVELAVSAMKLGAVDYLTKPIDNDILIELIKNILSKRELRKNQSSGLVTERGKLEHPKAFDNIISRNKEMIKIFNLVEKLAPGPNSVLVWGESGTGKELIAKAIHNISDRKNKKFIAVNAGTFADELFAHEFFGHSKGAFTGADKEKKGFLEEADKGTLFLDEIGELAVPVQVKLLRFLQEGEFFRLGSTKNIKSDVRIIAATNKNLMEEINKGNFRKDLFYRLNISSVYLPPLKKRKDDIPLLAYHFVKKFSENSNKKISKISDEVLMLLESYNFPGNVRELMNIINSAVIIENHSVLKKSSLPQYFLDNTKNKRGGGFGEGSIEEPEALKEIEEKHIKKTLEYTKYNRTKAAKILGISRVNLISKIKQYKEKGN